MVTKICSRHGPLPVRFFCKWVRCPRARRSPCDSLVRFAGELCKPYRQLELNNNADSTDATENEWTISFEQFEATMNAEPRLVNWFENRNEQSNNPSLATRINRYNQDVLR